MQGGRIVRKLLLFAGLILFSQLSVDVAGQSQKKTQARIVCSDGWPEMFSVEEFSTLDSIMHRMNAWEVRGSVENIGKRMAKEVWITVTIRNMDCRVVEVQSRKCWRRYAKDKYTIRAGDLGGFVVFGTYGEDFTWSWDIEWED